MNREIKFKAKRKNDNEWAFGFITSNNGKYWIGNFAFGNYWHSEVYPESIGQYTGLKDKNGKEIYEGDLVRSSQPNSQLGEQDDIYTVVFHNEYALFCLFTVSSSNKYRIGRYPLTRNNHPYFITGKRTEIIGNIYQNPELCSQPLT